MKKKKFILTIPIIIGICNAHADKEIITAQLTKYEEKYQNFYNSSLKMSRLTDSQKEKILETEYSRIFEITPDAVKPLGDRDILALFRAADTMDGYSTKKEHALQMLQYLKIMEKHEIATTPEIMDTYGALFAAREFSITKTFFESHPQLKLPPPPTLKQTTNKNHQRSVLLIPQEGLNLTRLNVDLSKGTHIVVIGHPLCQFTAHAVGDIDKDASLLEIFKNKATWITPVDRTIELKIFKNWNHIHPNQKYSITYSKDEWQDIDDWPTPTFLIYRDGRITAKIVGWPKQGNMKSLKEELSKAGLI